GSEGDVSVAIPVDLAAPPATNMLQVPSPTPAAALVPQESLAQAQITETDNLGLLLWYGLPTILITLVILSIVALILLTLQQRTAITASPAATDTNGRAYLVSQGQDARPYLVTRDSCRIGRGRDNEMYINDN